MRPTQLDQRLVRSLPGTLALNPVDAEGEPVILDGPVAVTVVDHTGAEVLTDVAATATDTGWTADVDADATASLARWTCTWTDQASAATRTTIVEVAGGHLFTVADARRSDPTLATHDADAIIAVRLVVEAEAEWICGVAFTPRLRIGTFDGAGEPALDVDDHECRTLISATANDVDVAARVTLDRDGTALLATGWPAGRANVALVWEAGWDAPTPDLRDALCLRARTLLQRPDTNVPLQALRFDGDAGGRYRLDRPSLFRTGVPDVDAVYQRHSKRASSDATGPAYGRLDLSAGPVGLFHGRR